MEIRTFPAILYDRSRTTTDWRCPHSRYLGYEWDGTGLAAETMALELYTGIVLHDGLSAIALGQPIDHIADLAANQMRSTLFDNSREEGASEADASLFAQEQAALTEGLLRGFHKHVWPRLCAEFPTIVAVEKELIFNHASTHPVLKSLGADKVMRFMAKPDLLVRDKEGGLWYVEYKSTGSNKDAWVNSWSSAVQLHSSIRAVEQEYGEKVAGIIVQGLYKGYVNYGKQTSPFCLVPDTKVLTVGMRWVPIGDIEQGDILAGFDEEPVERGGYKARYWQEAKVTRIGHDRQPCVRLTFNDGTKVTCSKEHLWLTAWEGHGPSSRESRWVKAEDLRPADVFGTRASRVHRIGMWEAEDSREAGYLAGAFDGEGYLSHIKKGRDLPSLVAGFSQKPGAMMNRVNHLLQKRGFPVHGPYDPHENRAAGTLSVGNRLEVLRLLGTVRPLRLLNKLDLNKVGVLRAKGSVVLVSIEDVGMQEVVPIETSTGTLFAEGLTSHNCYAYHRPGNPPFTKESWSYSYVAGFKKFPVWEKPGGVKQWVEHMPAEQLAEQFPQVPPIFIKDDLIDRFFAQRALREAEIALASRTINDPATPSDTKQSIIDAVFPQRFDQCTPSFGKACQFARLCHGQQGINPLDHGFVRRTPHHDPEVELWKEKGIVNA